MQHRPAYNLDNTALTHHNYKSKALSHVEIKSEHSDWKVG